MNYIDCIQEKFSDIYNHIQNVFDKGVVGAHIISKLILRNYDECSSIQKEVEVNINKITPACCFSYSLTRKTVQKGTME